jgi:tetratricopeptide (TPR) repeat protein
MRVPKTVVCRTSLAILLGMIAGVAVRAAPVSGAVDWAGPDAQAIRKLIDRGDWEGAARLADKHRDPKGQAPVPWGALGWLLHRVSAPLPESHETSLVLSRVAARGDIAAFVGLYEAAIRGYQQAIDEQAVFEAVRPWEFTYGPNHLYAFEAARCAVRLRDWPRAVSYLELMTDSKGQTAAQAQTQVAIVNSFAAAPDNVANRLDVAETFYLGQGVPSALPSRGVLHSAAYQDDLRFLRDTLELHPTREQIRRTYSLIASLAETNGDQGTLDRTLQTVVEKLRGEDYGAATALRLGELYQEHAPGRAAGWFGRVVRDYENTYWATDAHLKLAELAWGADNTKAMLEHLEAAARGSADKPALADGSFCFNAKYEAHLWLGNYYRDLGNYQHALVHYRAWVPLAIDANGYESLDSYRDWRMAECLVHLGQADRALEKILTPRMGDDGLMLAFHQQGVWGMAKLTVDIYEKRGELDAVPDLMEAYRRDTTEPGVSSLLPPMPPLPAAVLWVAQLRVWARDKDIGRLVGALEPHGDGSSCLVFDYNGQLAYEEQIAAAEVLADVGSAAVPALKAKYRELAAGVDPADPEKGYCHRALIAYALGLSRSPAARAYLKGLLRRAPEVTEATPTSDRAKAFAAVGITRDDLKRALALRDEGE